MVLRLSCLFTLALLISVQNPAPAAVKNLSAVEGEFLSADWSTVASTLEKDPGAAADPIGRMLMAHALLAQNLNDRAYAAFTSVSSRDALSRWLSYTKGLARRHPTSSIALLLKGDAYARLGSYSDALSNIDAALAIHHSGLGFAMRGVIAAHFGNLNGAVVDLTRATTLEPRLAETWLALATVMARLDASDGAELSLNTLDQIDESIALSHIIRSVLAFRHGDFPTALSHLDEARRLQPIVASVADFNEAVIVSAYEGFLEEIEDVLTSTGQGVPLEITVQAVAPRIVRERIIPGGDERTAYLGESIPSLSDYFVPPETPQIGLPTKRQVVHDQIVLHVDHSKLVGLIDQGIAIAGASRGRSGVAQEFGPADQLKLESNTTPHPWSNSTRLKVMDDGTWALMQIDAARGIYTPLQEVDAVRFLHGQLAYAERLGGERDISYLRLFENLADTNWKSSFAEVPVAQLAEAVVTPQEKRGSKEVTVVFRGDQYQMTAKALLAGNLPRLERAFEGERATTRQFRQLHSDAMDWDVVLPAPRQPLPERPRRDVFDSAGYPGAKGGPFGPPPAPWAHTPPNPGSVSPGPQTRADYCRKCGGISTKELALAWVDRAEWNLEIPFTLSYSTVSSGDALTIHAAPRDRLIDAD